jgi:hypothetical protein
MCLTPRSARSHDGIAACSSPFTARRQSLSCADAKRVLHRVVVIPLRGNAPEQAPRR